MTNPDPDYEIALTLRDGPVVNPNAHRIERRVSLQGLETDGPMGRI
jgi:hypothetical protein